MVRVVTFLVFGHRGSPATHPENSLEGFRHALAVGADALELDVHVTRDGRVVVFHDDDGGRVAGVHRPVADLTWGELRAWDLGHSFLNAEGARPFSGVRVPLLEAVLAELPGVTLNIDIKAKGRHVVPTVLRVLRAHAGRDPEKRVIRIASFSQRTLGRVRRAGYEGPSGLGPLEVAALRLLPPNVARHLVVGDAAQVPLAEGPLRFDTASFIDRAHALGRVVHFWTIDAETTALRLRALGADGIVTNDPARMVAALRKS
jgi:glycerophosphoryl diester phosphodiesterase